MAAPTPEGMPAGGYMGYPPPMYYPNYPYPYGYPPQAAPTPPDGGMSLLCLRHPLTATVVFSSAATIPLCGVLRATVSSSA